MYGLHELARMMADGCRTGPYLESVRRVVRPGDVVLEVGTGFGHIAVAACRAGASRVYAVELDADALRKAAELVQANGVADRVKLVHGHSMHVDIPERATVFIEDIRGVLPFFGDRIPSLVDARRRLLHDGFRAVAVRDDLWAAPSEMPWDFARMVPSAAPHLAELNTAPLEHHLRNDWCKVRADSAQLLGPPAKWGAIDLVTVESPHVQGGATWRVSRSGTLAGIVTWFDAALGGGVVMHTGPDFPVTVYRQAYLPLTREVGVAPGDTIIVELRARYESGAYVLAWHTTVRDDGGRPKADFRQSSLAAVVASTSALQRRQEEHVPQTGRTGQVMRTLLAMSDTGQTHRQIALALAEAHPGYFRTPEDAVEFTTRWLAAMEDVEADERAAHS
jgi:protein arginine N-methyltransferase 1